MHAAEQPLQPADLRGTLLLRDCLGAEGAFLLVQLVKAALGNGQPSTPTAPAHPAAAAAARIVLLAAAHAASHYTAVLRKAGMHSPALIDAGRLAVVEAMPAQGGLPSLRDLHQRLAAAAGGSSSGGGSSSACSSGVVLVLDDLTVCRSCCRLLRSRASAHCNCLLGRTAWRWPLECLPLPPSPPLARNALQRLIKHSAAPRPLQALRCLADSEADWAAFLQACTALGQVRIALRLPSVSAPACCGHKRSAAVCGRHPHTVSPPAKPINLPALCLAPCLLSA